MNMKSLIYFAVTLSLLLTFYSCKDQECISATECTMSPESGDCLAAIPKYYFDPTDGNCKEFTWGGCGDYPFDTLTECQLADCGCN